MFNKKLNFIKILIITTSLVTSVQVQLAQAAKQYLYQWNAGNGTTWPDWTYKTDVRYGNPGFTRDNHTVVSSQNYPEMVISVKMRSVREIVRIADGSFHC